MRKKAGILPRSGLAAELVTTAHWKIICLLVGSLALYVK